MECSTYTWWRTSLVVLFLLSLFVSYSAFVCLYLYALQEDRGFNEFSFDEFEKQMAAEEEGFLAAGDEDGDGDEADLFG